jgi:hypothetical protein
MRRSILRERIVWTALLAGSSVSCMALKAGDTPAPQGTPDAGAEAAGAMDDARVGDGPGISHDTNAPLPDAAGGDAGEPADGDAGTDAEAVVETSVALPPTPRSVSPDHLRLWLAADMGVTCTSGRVVRWADQSSHGDDALLNSGQLGPQCRITPVAHAINGVDVPYFSAPIAATSPNMLDETLDVDLGFLVNTGYTVFVVERRWSDQEAGSQSSEFVLGTVLSADDQKRLNVCPYATNVALALGYDYYNGVTQIAFDQSCNTLWSNVASVPPSGPVPVSQDTAIFDPTSGHELWVNGVSQTGDVNVVALTSATGGAIGRAFLSNPSTDRDQRFRGDIAEVIVYDSALDDVDRLAIESYLKSHWNY